METLERLEAVHLRSAIVSYRDALREHRDVIDGINVFPVPDADTGTNMALTLESVVAALEDGADMAATCDAVAHGALMGGRGMSGVILSQVLRSLVGTFGGSDAVDGRAFADGLAAASKAAYTAVSRPREGTILTVVREAAEAARAATADGEPLVGVLEGAASAARAALARTPELLPILKEAGVVDAGGAGFALLLDALLHVVDGRELPRAAVPTHAVAVVGSRPVARVPRYEVALLLDAPDEAIPAFRERWGALGDSVIVVGGGGVWRCHIHADDPDAAVEAGREFGRTRDVRVTDLSEQVAGGGADPAEP